MPRTTRRSLAQETPTRSSPRASTKASTAASGSPAKTTRGRRGAKAEEPAHAEPEEPTTKRGRGRSSEGSTGRGGRQSRSRGRRGAGDEEEETEEKTTPPSASRRGQGKGKAETSPAEGEVDDEGKEEEEKEEEEESTPKGRGRSRGRGRGKSPAATTPRGSRSSRRSGAADEEVEDATPDKVEKTTPTRGRGRGRAASSRSRGRPGRGKDEDGGEEEKEMDTSATADAEEKEETADAKADAESEGKPEDKKESEDKKETETAPAEPKPSPEKPAPAAEADKPAESATKPAAEPMEQDTTSATPKPDVNNGDISDKPEPQKLTGIKRKLEEEDTAAVAEAEQESKRAKINGEEADALPTKAEAPAPTTPQKEAASAGAADAEILQDFVVVNKDDVPPADSSEVAAAVPQAAPPVPQAAAAVVPMETEAAAPEAGSGTTDEPVVVPLTEAEVAKAYASQVQQVKNTEDRDEVSSIVVEVGSVAGSDVTGMSRGLDTSEVQSATNSIDGEDTADSSISEPQAMSTPAAAVDPAEMSTQFPSQPAAQPQVVAQPPQATGQPPVVAAQPPAPANLPQAFSAPNPVPVPQAASLNASFPAQNAVDVSNNGLCGSKSADTGTSVDLIPTGKESSSVTDRLGNPDPAFLAKHKSPSIFQRAFVPNVNAPGDLLDPARCFSVVSYNILAECARVRADYSYTAPEFLTQEYRHALLMRELQYLDGDVVCLQEVNPAYFNTVLLPEMRRLGYDGMMIKRTKDYFDEGEATFYKTALFELETSRKVSLAEVARKEVEAGGLRPEVGTAVNKYLDRADVVLILKLRSKVTGKSFTIGNIHVVWDKLTSPDVQCIQVACAIKEVVEVAGGVGAPHMICGDFNSEWNSPAYQLALDGYLSDTSIRKLQAVEKLELAEGSRALVNHLWRAFQHTSSNLKSAYSTVTGSEPEITTLTGSMRNSVDYVFYSSESLIPTGVLKTVDKDVVLATGGLPDRDFPSDHLSMKAVMAFTK